MISSKRRFCVRAGWEVWMAPDLGGSFEEPPPTIYDHLKRDRRWARAICNMRACCWRKD